MSNASPVVETHESFMEKPGRGRDAGRPAPPAQSPPACHFAAGASEVSRCSCGEFPDVHGFSDRAGASRRLRKCDG